MSVRIELDFTTGYDLSTTITHLRDGCSDGCSVIRALAEQMEAATKPPRIPEPGLWGVVLDGLRILVRHSASGKRAWLDSTNNNFVAWDEIDNPELVRDGIEGAS